MKGEKDRNLLESLGINPDTYRKCRKCKSNVIERSCVPFICKECWDRKLSNNWKMRYWNQHYDTIFGRRPRIKTKKYKEIENGNNQYKQVS